MSLAVDVRGARVGSPDDGSWGAEVLDHAAALLEAQREVPNRGLDHDDGLGLGW